MPDATSALPLEIDVRSVKSLLESDAEFLLLDCREPREHAFVKLEKATLIPMGEIPARVVELESARDKQIIVYCHLGGRSLQVTHWLRQNGFPKAQNMAGGIDLWATDIDPSLPRY